MKPNGVRIFVEQFGHLLLVKPNCIGIQLHLYLGFVELNPPTRVACNKSN